MNGRRALDLSLVLLAVALGCSALVDPRNDEPRCDQPDGAARVCPEGLSCVEGRCKRACGTEVCRNNIDDDCDGQIDEVDALGRDTCGDAIDNDCDGTVDEGSDYDNDGYTWCGNTAAPDPDRPSIDCDDRLASVNPGLPENCDGQDNDCDSRVDEDSGGALCPSGYLCATRCIPRSCASEGPRTICGANERCDVATGECVARDCTRDPCRENEVCDMASKTCRPRQPLPNGSPCAVDSDCVSSACIDAASLRFAEAGRVCGQACCADGQCPSNQRCFASGTGARSCLPVDLLPDTTPTECVTNDACGAFQVCGLERQQQFGPPQFMARNNVITSNCLLALAPLAVGDRCTSFPECNTHICTPGQLFGNVCSNPCGSSNDCRGLGERVGGLGAYCRYIDVTLDNAPNDYAAVCVVRRSGETGTGMYGAACATGADCLEGGCVDATSTSKGRCTPTCCNDAQCGLRSDGTASVCRPYAFGDRYEMRCAL
ncbi:MAG TPA: putative metal-binding motif-containing protein [Polyangiales bacterium]